MVRKDKKGALNEKGLFCEAVAALYVANCSPVLMGLITELVGDESG